MHIAVIGAGIVGLATAHELSVDGHQVTLFERQAAAASEASFANAGVLAPGHCLPWAAPGMLPRQLAQAWRRDAAVRLAALPNAALAQWLWRTWRAAHQGAYQAHCGALSALADLSLERTRQLAIALQIDLEQAQGVLILLRGASEVRQSRAGLRMLADLGVDFHLVDAAACRRIELALDTDSLLQAGIHLPRAGVGNCRQFALGLKLALQQRGVTFHFSQTVQRLSVGATVQVKSIAANPRAIGGQTRDDHFDAVAVCAAVGSDALLRPLGLRLPLYPIHGYSITLPVRQFEAHPDVGPRAALIDARHQVTISRLGDRVRVAGISELGGRLDRMAQAPIAMLYRVLQDWFPGAASQGQAQTWKGARPTLPDGPPAIGSAGVPGVWVNTGHGSNGWALACGSARLLADVMGGRSTAVDPTRFSPQRWR